MPVAAPSTPARVRAAARSLISARGHGVTVDEIVALAGLAKPTFYAHFASKEALTKAVLEETVDTFFIALEKELALRGDPVERLLAPFDLLGADLPDPDYRGCICLNAAASFPSPDHMSHAVLRAHDDRLGTVFADLAREAGLASPDALSRQLVILFDGVKARALADSSQLPARDARDAARALIDAARRKRDRRR